MGDSTGEEALAPWAGATGSGGAASCTEHGRPGLVDDVQAHGPRPAGTRKEWALGDPKTKHRKQARRRGSHLVDIRVEDAVAEADGGGVVRVALGKLDVHLPRAAGVQAW